MITWQGIQRHLRSNHEPAMDEPDWLGLLAPCNGILRKVRVLHLQDQGAVRIAVEVGGEHTMNHRQALRCNQALVASALCLEDRGLYVLRSQRTLDELTAASFQRLLDAVLHELTMVTRVTGESLDTDNYSMYAE